MRKLFVTVLAATAMALLGACSGGGSPAPTNSADQTREVCAAAQAEALTAAASLSTQLDALAQVANDEAKANEIKAGIRQQLDSWRVKVEAWATQNVTSSVRSALDDAAGTLRQLGDPGDETSVDKAKARVAEIGTKLVTACRA